MLTLLLLILVILLLFGAIPTGGYGVNGEPVVWIVVAVLLVVVIFALT